MFGWLPGELSVPLGPSTLAACSLSGKLAGRSASGNVLPGNVLVDARLAGKAEHPLAEDVAHDLGRAALDGGRPAAQIPVEGGVLRIP